MVFYALGQGKMPLFTWKVRDLLPLKHMEPCVWYNYKFYDCRILILNSHAWILLFLF